MLWESEPQQPEQEPDDEYVVLDDSSADEQDEMHGEAGDANPDLVVDPQLPGQVEHDAKDASIAAGLGQLLALCLTYGIAGAGEHAAAGSVDG